MTPAPVKVYKPSTADNYDISDLHSDDDTDDEDRPRKKIPNWASGLYVISGRSLLNDGFVGVSVLEACGV